MARTLIASDDFNRANAAVGANWSYIRDTAWQAAPPEVYSNQITARADATHYQVIAWNGAGSFTNKQYAKIAISGFSFSGADQTVGAAVMVSGSNATANFYSVSVADNAPNGSTKTATLRKMVAGTATTIATITTVTWTNGDTIEIEYDADTDIIKIFKNGSQIGSDYTGQTDLTTGKPGIVVSASSNTLPVGDNWEGGDVVGDITGPTLASATATVTGQTTATVGATTDEANGTMYAVVTTSATQPSIAQIVAGQDHTGSAAVYAGNQVITTTGAKTFSATGLTAATAYYAHMVHRDAASNDSNRLSTSQFTTLPNAPTAPTIGTTTSITSSGATINWTDNSSNEVSFQVQVETPSGAGNWTNASTGASNPTAANATSLVINGLSSSTEYRPRVRASNTGGDSAYSTGTAFTTAAGGGGSTLLPKLMQLLH